VICKKYSFQKLTQFSHGNNGLEFRYLLTWMVLIGDIQVFLQFSWVGLFGTSKAYLHLKHQSCGKDSFQTLTQFSEGKNVLDAPASNIDGFLSRYIYVSSTHLNRPVWSNISILPPWKLQCEEVFLSKTNSILTRKQCIRCFCF
jgi:hypothetical protein